jgi:hypothetical protein
MKTFGVVIVLLLVGFLSTAVPSSPRSARAAKSRSFGVQEEFVSQVAAAEASVHTNTNITILRRGF